MARPRRTSTVSTRSTGVDHDASSTSHGRSGGQEMGSMYDYLAKIILLGPSGCGKSCLLHRFVKDEWRVLSSQTIGVEFANKIVKVGGDEPGVGGASYSSSYPRHATSSYPFSSSSAVSGGQSGGGDGRRKRIKLQLWDTAGTERFRSVSRSYYRGAAGALLVYDVANPRSFAELPTFLNDARALASPQVAVLLVGNKLDLAVPGSIPLISTSTPSTTTSRRSLLDSRNDEEDGEEDGEENEEEWMAGSLRSTTSTSTIMGPSAGSSQQRATVSADGRQVPASTAANWATQQRIPGVVEVSALSGDGVSELFHKLARTILTKIELGEIDPDDPMSGIQYGDADYHRYEDGGSSVRSGGLTSDGYRGSTKRRRRRVGWSEALQLRRPSSSGGGKRTCC